MNNYQIIKEIGVGNYGKALLAKNMEDHNLYVIKVNNKLNQSIDISSLTQDQIDYAHCEVDVIKSLHHPYIIKYIDSFYEDG
jgi:serine/threonine protein kinase